MKYIKGREICHLDLSKDLNWRTDAFFDCDKLKETSWFNLVIYSCLKEGAFTAVKANLQFDAVTPLACDSWFLLSFEHGVGEAGHPDPEIKSFKKLKIKFVKY